MSLMSALFICTFMLSIGLVRMSHILYFMNRISLPVSLCFLYPLSCSFCSIVVCFDAKINFDDNAEFRQKAIFAMDDMTESDPTETEAAKFDLKYIGLDGNIACFGEFGFLQRSLAHSLTHTHTHTHKSLTTLTLHFALAFKASALQS